MMKHTGNARDGGLLIHNGCRNIRTIHVVIILVLGVSLLLTSCGKPSPKRVVERYLEEITKPEVNEERIELYTMERYRERLKQNALLTQVMEAGGNYYNIFAPIMSEEDYVLIQDEYDFKITYRENSEATTALVQVYVRPVSKRGVKTGNALNSDTLHPLLKQVLKESTQVELQFTLKLIEENWKIRDVIYPAILDEVISERATPTVVIPIPDEVEIDEDPPADAEGKNGDDA